MSDLIPSGKHKGKRLSELPTVILLGMQNAWNGIDRLRESPFFDKITDEVVSRNLSVETNRVRKRLTKARAESKSAPKLTGMVEAKCFNCGNLSKISANSWAGEGIASKPKCSCGGMIYLADQSLCVTFVGEVHFGKRVR